MTKLEINNYHLYTNWFTSGESLPSYDWETETRTQINKQFCILKSSDHTSQQKKYISVYNSSD